MLLNSKNGLITVNQIFRVKVATLLTSLTSSFGIPARSMAAFTATAPSSDADRLARLPLKDPMGVLTAEAITTSFSDTFDEYAAVITLKNC